MLLFVFFVLFCVGCSAFLETERRSDAFLVLEVKNHHRSGTCPSAPGQGNVGKAIKLLLDAGCDVNAANKTGVRAIHHASGNGELKCRGCFPWGGEVKDSEYGKPVK